ncbi:uncharacterized protein [Venturia canescens]|uniref:uncharacterized protein isoform X2 n=1 Tax=Venturia canescens TaxID=32260 RepID=UPI001C9BD45C|nr:uncharacterized protein LOC122417852 isoform X2 [Venturia canescens]
MDGYPVLQIVRCQFGSDVAAVNLPASSGYPFGPHSHSHLTHPLSHAHLTAYRCPPSHPYGPNSGDNGGCCKKYVVLCCLCGGLSAAVGSLFLAVHAVLSAHTASLALFETVPSYIPGSMLILMGLFTILLARRKHRYGFLMKMCGSVGVVCALVCVLVTVTTTVVHMSRLQGLRECIYTERARSCTCYGSTQGRVLSDPGVLFEETPHCEAVHGALYDCLRALFGVSVAGILACIFSCMLLYQLLSHEKKKMYWEQLQLRCRSLYGQGGSGAVGAGTGGSCGCCNDCGGTSPWWAQTPGNLYTPNPDLAPFSRRWRLPWSRSRGPAPTPDSNYGFHTQSRGAVVMRSSGSSSGEPGDNTPGPYTVLTDESQNGSGAPYSLINSTGSAPYGACASSVASYSLLENGPVPALWGPPPPYSDPNSPARRPQISEERRAPGSTIRCNSTGTTPVNAPANRISSVKRIENFEPVTCDEYRQQRATNMRPSDNYENTEEVMFAGTEPDIEMGNLHLHNHHLAQRAQKEEGTKGRHVRKALKGVENGGFQQEPGNNSLNKQSESELYFGDVSSCCGPESSFYDLAVEKDQQSSAVDSTDNLIEYPASSRFSRQRQSSKRARQPLPLGSSHTPEASAGPLAESYSPLNSISVAEEFSRSSSSRGPFLAPDAQYEVIDQQTRYTYYSPKNSASGAGSSGEHVLEIPLPSLASLAYRSGNSSEQQIDLDEIDGSPDYGIDRLSLEGRGNKGKPGTPVAKSPTPSSLVEDIPSSPNPLGQRSGSESTGNSRDSLWPGEHQSRPNENVCPVNV